MSVSDFTNDPAAISTPVAVEGTVVAVPSGPDDLLHIVIPSFDSDQDIGPCPFMPRVDASGDYVPPQVGDRCLVVFTQQGGAWVVAYATSDG